MKLYFYTLMLLLPATSYAMDSKSEIVNYELSPDLIAALSNPPTLPSELTTAMNDYSAANQKWYAAAGAGVGATGYWIHSLNIPSLVRTQHRAGKTRFVDLAAAAASPLVKPLVTLAGLAFTWHTVKGIVNEPLKLRQQQEIEKFKAALTKHEQDVQRTLATYTARYNSDHQKLLEELHKVTTEVDKELRTIVLQNSTLKDAITQNTYSALKTQQERNNALQTKLEKDSRELEEHLKQLEAQQDIRHELLSAIMSDTQEALDGTKTDLQKVRTTTQAMENKTSQAVAGMQRIVTTVQGLAQNSAANLAAVQKLAKPENKKK